MLPEKEAKDLRYQVAFSLVPGIGPKTAKILLEHFGSPEDTFQADKKQLIQLLGPAAGKFTQLFATALERADKELEFAAQNGIRCITTNHPDFPYRLLHCQDAPFVLYGQGNFNLNADKVVAVVGTRQNTQYGLDLCHALIRDLGSYEDILVVSGMAYGIDAAAHKECVQAGISTVGVLAHGLDRLYPAAHKPLASKMKENGGLISEFPSGTNPDKGNFPVRNRIVAGMSDVVVVVESNWRGGAVITAYLAAGYNREVAAFPGRVNDPKSKGCNELIKRNIAAMITDANDLGILMGWNTKPKQKSLQPQLLLNLTAEQQAVINVLNKKETLHSDEIQMETSMNSTTLAATLLGLEMQGLIKTLPGKYYRRC